MTTYNIEFGKFDGSPPKWVADLSLSYESFDEAKTDMLAVSQELIEDSEVCKEKGIQIRMVDNEKNPPRIFHYITANHPGVSLPSKE